MKPKNITEFDDEALATYLLAHRVLVLKQTDYGPSNIANAPGGPLNGLRVRIFDKVSRINNLLDTGAEPQNESLKDSFLDLANYAIIGLMVLNEKWPDPKEWNNEV